MDTHSKAKPGSWLWLGLGVFAGVLLAQLLSSWMSPLLAWLLGGAVIGLAPAVCDTPRSPRRLLLTVVCTAVVAATAYGLAALL